MILNNPTSLYLTISTLNSTMLIPTLLRLRLPFSTLSAHSPTPSPTFQHIYGINPIQLALVTKRRKLQTLIISDSQSTNTSYRITKLINLAHERNIPIVFKSKDNMNGIVKGQPHQNVILRCSMLSARVVREEEIGGLGEGLYVFCDKITDTQNLGAIIRTALFFGAKGVFVSKKNSAPLNSTVSKASSGALQLMPIYTTLKQQQFLKCWHTQTNLILSTTVSSQTTSPITPQQCRVILQNQKQKYKKILLILGSQGYGVSPHLARNADISVCIQRTGFGEYPYNLVDSMNVNTALSCILYELMRKKQE